MNDIERIEATNYFDREWQKKECERSLHSFFKTAWPQIEGNTSFVDGWHIQAIAEHLEAVHNGDIKKLLINVPPRSGKTGLISIMFPAWVWTHDPSIKFLYASYATKISWEHSRLCKSVIESPWYQSLWGKKYQLLKDQSTKSHFVNTEHGYRVSTSATAGTTALGGNVLVCDDINSAGGMSDVKRDATNEFMTRVWPSRLNPGSKLGAQIVVQQRIHEMDVTGYLMDKDINNEWVKLILPMEFEVNRRSKTILSSLKKWEDPRTKEGELLWPEAFSAQDVARKKLELGSYNYAGQYLQRPAPEEGGIIKKTWFKWWKEIEPPQIDFLLQSWDTAFSEKKTSSYSACTTWGIFRDEHGRENLILLGCWRKQVDYPVLREMAKRLYFDYRDTGEKHNSLFKGRPLDMCLIEGKATGDPLMQDLRLAGLRPFAFNPGKYGDKERRVHLISPMIESGMVWLPARPPYFSALLPFADDFEQQIILFPNGASRDVIDTMSQALIKMKEGGLLINPKDPVEEIRKKKEAHVYGYLAH